MNERYITSTCRVFNTVYSLAKRCRPFSDVEDEIELQIRNDTHEHSMGLLPGDYCLAFYLNKSGDSVCVIT